MKATGKVPNNTSSIMNRELLTFKCHVIHSGTNFNPDVLFHPLTCQNSAVTNVLQRWKQVVCLCVLVVNFQSWLQECAACKGDELRDVIFKK